MYKKAFLIAALTMGASLPSVALSEPCVPVWQEQFRNGADGEVVRGSKVALFEAIRRGDDVRVAWGGAFGDGQFSVEHYADPAFLTIVGSDEVVLQTPEHIAQASYPRMEGALFGDQPNVMWRGLLRTDGVFDAVWIDRGTGEVVRKSPQRAAMSWLTRSLPPACETRAPIELAIPNGVRLDKERETVAQKK